MNPKFAGLGLEAKTQLANARLREVRIYFA